MRFNGIPLATSSCTTFLISTPEDSIVSVCSGTLGVMPYLSNQT